MTYDYDSLQALVVYDHSVGHIVPVNAPTFT